MKLTYRGTTYNYAPSQAVPHRPFQQVRKSEVAHHVIYRGATYRVDLKAKPAKIFAQPMPYELIYRGMTYLVN